jgi:hypothetical protein
VYYGFFLFVRRIAIAEFVVNPPVQLTHQLTTTVFPENADNKNVTHGVYIVATDKERVKVF